MRLTPSFILAAALFDLGSAIPAEAAGLGPAGRGPGGMHGPQQPSPGDLPGVPATGDGKGVSVASQSDVEVSTDDEARFAIKCDQRGWTYLYSWWPYVLFLLLLADLVPLPPLPRCIPPVQDEEVS